MVRRSLIVAALLAVASPLNAQDEWVWNADRPDAVAPAGVRVNRTLPAGAVELRYRLSHTRFTDLYQFKAVYPLSSALLDYQAAPMGMSQQLHQASVAFGATDDLTLMATAEFDIFARDQITSGGTLYTTTIKDIGDVTATALYDVIDRGPYRASLELGAVVPVGNDITRAVTPFTTPNQQALPYEMRTGGGTFAVVPGATAAMQNERGSVGATLSARINVGRNRGYQLGDRYEANGWGAVAVNDALSTSVGIRYLGWGRVEGGDAELDPTQDPGMDARLLGGVRVDLPVGFNFRFPETSPLAGHLLGVEAAWTVHHDYDGPQLGADWALALSYRVGL